MKIKLTQSGFENYNGQMGVHWFEKGVSTNDVSTSDAMRMASVMGCEWENGDQCNAAAILNQSMNVEAPIMRNIDGVEDDSSIDVDNIQEQDYSVQPSKYTIAELEKIADEKGIQGLRDIAEPLEVKGRSIKELIDGIMKKG